MFAGGAEQERSFPAVNLDDDDAPSGVEYECFDDFHAAFALDCGNLPPRKVGDQSGQPSLSSSERKQPQQPQHDGKSGDVSGGVQNVPAGNSFLFNAALSGAAQLHHQQTGVENESGQRANTGNLA